MKIILLSNLLTFNYTKYEISIILKIYNKIL